MRRSIYLLADSSLLFWDGLRLRDELPEGELSAAYIGASNGDEPEYYGIFEAAMDAAGVSSRRMIRSRYSAMDDLCLGGADVIVLAGGDVARGWEVMVSRGMRETIVRRYLSGAVLIGVSAGAVQLGQKGFGPEGLFETFGFAPFIVDVHDEGAGWSRLRPSVEDAGGSARGLGIPLGAGVALRPDDTLEPLRRPVRELRVEDGRVVESLLLPPALAR